MQAQATIRSTLKPCSHWLCNTSAAWRRLREQYHNGTTRRTCEQCHIHNIKVFVPCFGVISSCHATRTWRRMTETSALLISVIFQSCIFQPCIFVRHFPVLHFPALHFCSSFSCPAFSSPSLLSVIFQSCIPPPNISLSIIFLSCIFSAPETITQVRYNHTGEIQSPIGKSVNDAALWEALQWTCYGFIEFITDHVVSQCWRHEFVCTPGDDVGRRCADISYVTARTGESQVQLQWTDGVGVVVSQGL